MFNLEKKELERRTAEDNHCDRVIVVEVLSLSPHAIGETFEMNMAPVDTNIPIVGTFTLLHGINHLKGSHEFDVVNILRIQNYNDHTRKCLFRHHMQENVISSVAFLFDCVFHMVCCSC